MNTLQFMLVLAAQGFFMVLFAFAFVYGLASLLGIGEDAMDIRITFFFFAVSCIVLYGTSFGIFAGVQKDSCGEVKNWSQIAMNAAIPTLVQVVLLSIVLFVPWFQNIVGDLLPPDTPAFGKSATAFAYYTFWATLLGGALGGTLSGSCNIPTAMPTIPTMPLAETGVEGFGNEKHVRFNLPPE